LNLETNKGGKEQARTAENNLADDRSVKRNYFSLTHALVAIVIGLLSVAVINRLEASFDGWAGLMPVGYVVVIFFTIILAIMYIYICLKHITNIYRELWLTAIVIALAYAYGYI
jgi:hypothetical protein